jgi:MSHA pilin protein MshD
MSTELRRRPRHAERGVTLIELILFMVIIAVALTAIIGIMNFTTRHNTDPVRRKQALMLAEAFLEEVELAKFSYCDVFDPRAGDDNPATAPTGPADCASATVENWGAEANNQRPFDNVNDYVAKPGEALAAFGAGTTLRDANGNALPLDGFTASVAIRPDALGSGGAVIGNAGATAAQTDVLRITVTIGYDGQTLSLDGYRTRYAPASL